MNGIIRMLITWAFGRETQYSLWAFRVGLADLTCPKRLFLGSIGPSNE